MNILERFDQDERFKRLARRRSNFRAMVGHVYNKYREHGAVGIIETGSAWDTGNWEGQGQSTLIWDWLIEQVGGSNAQIDCTSIDVRQESVDNSKAQTKFVEYICGDAVAEIAKLNSAHFTNVFLLYLDSYDWTPQLNIESAFHHMAELTACYRLLPPGCMVVVDDRHGDEQGKHFMVEAFFSHYLKLNPVFKNHQIGFIKP